MMWLRLAALALLLGVQTPNPDYVGPEDPAHFGQPKSCSNSPHIVAVKRDCKCEKKTPEACQPEGNSEDRSCYVYCRKPACKCHHAMCETE
jgi:hypothetical protein